MSRRQAAATGSGTETTAQERGFFMFKSVFPPQRALVTITFEGEAIQGEEGPTCLIPVREGMSVKRQSGAPSFRTEENK